MLYGTGNGDAYGYDEFGRDMHAPGNEEAGRYSRQRGKQPFGYTGYRHDEISGTYFAQAREYRAELGRFTAEDVIRGNGAVPQTMNGYGYCWGNPMYWIDLDGLNPVDSVIGYFTDKYERKEKSYWTDIYMEKEGKELLLLKIMTNGVIILWQIQH